MTNFFAVHGNYSISSFKQCPHCLSGQVSYNKHLGYYYCTKCGRIEPYPGEWTIKQGIR